MNQGNNNFEKSEISQEEVEQLLKEMEDDGFNVNGLGEDASSIDSAPDKYHDPATQHFSDGMSMTSVIPQGKYKGVVVPRSNSLGQIGYKKKKDKFINVNPMSNPKLSCTVNMNSFTKEEIAKVCNLTSHIPDRRLAASMAYKKLAELQQTKSKLPATEQTVKYAAVNETQQSSISRPSEKFYKQKEVLAVETNVPEVTVVYEVEGFGQLTAHYHEVIRQDECLILVYDDGFKLGHKFFPDSSDKQFIVDVANHPFVYQVICPGIRFKLKNYDICVMVIVDEVNK